MQTAQCPLLAALDGQNQRCCNLPFPGVRNSKPRLRYHTARPSTRTISSSLHFEGSKIHFFEFARDLQGLLGLDLATRFQRAYRVCRYSTPSLVIFVAACPRNRSSPPAHCFGIPVVLLSWNCRFAFTNAPLGRGLGADVLGRCSSRVGKVSAWSFSIFCIIFALGLLGNHCSVACSS